jgi:hypothetical protein
VHGTDLMRGGLIVGGPGCTCENDMVAHMRLGLFKQDEELLRKFPPRRMTGLSPFDLIWQTPEDHATTMEYYTFACMMSYLSTINQG